jgi:uncharacterized protein YbaR (Trm112 family)
LIGSARRRTFVSVAEPDQPEDLCEVIACPICGGEMQLAYDREPMKICVCTNCLSSLSVTAEGWRILQERLRGSKT